MTLEYVHSYLTHPAKNMDRQPEIRGTAIEENRPLHDMLSDVFERAPGECNIDIIFRPSEEGEQENECRDQLVAYARSPSTERGRELASRLQEVTTHRSGLGLLFLMKGRTDDEHQVVLSRFPAEQGVLAEETEDQLSVQFIERVFLRNTRAYKSALYISDSFRRGFWEGRAVDRQISGPRELSDYWIHEFLDSHLRTTSAAGSKRMADSLRTAIRETDVLEVRQEVVAASRLLRQWDDERVSANQAIERLGLSEEARSAITDAFARSDLMGEVFRFDSEEFNRHAPYRAVELDNGGVLIAENRRFREVFDREVLSAAEQRVRYSTEGRVVDDQLKKRR